MSLTIILGIIFIHFIADFVFQTHWQASNKSKSNFALTMHIINYSLTWLFVMGAYSLVTGNIAMVACFPAVTFICHWITDYFTSRVNSYLYAKGDIHNFFVSVGFDQVLHYAQLFLTFYLLTN